MNEDKHNMMAVDLTAPISWIKGSDCKIEGTEKRCNRVFETLKEEVKEVKRKLSNKLHKKKKIAVENSII